MAYANSRSVRFQDDLELTKITPRGNKVVDLEYKIDGTHIPEPSSKKADWEVPEKTRRSFRSKVLPRVFSEDHERVKKKILDPQGPVIRRWNKIFVGACLISLFIDPLFAYLPEVESIELCVAIGMPLKVALTIVRSIADLFYLVNIFVRFRTAYVAPSLRVFGRGELVIDPSKIALRYLAKSFWIDLVVALPLPQVLIWAIIPNLNGPAILPAIMNSLRFIIIFQYLPRLILVFKLSSQVAKSAGVVTNTPWAGAAYNLMLFVLAGHVLGACFYLLQIERQESCWKQVCRLEMPSCQYSFFDCHERDNPSRVNWFNSSNVTNLCTPTSSATQGFIEFGIYGHAVNLTVANSTFTAKYLYCQWWGLMNLSSLGQNLTLSTYVGELIFAMTVPIIGMILFALVIGNMQTYLQSNSARLEEWRNKASDAEQWMRHRQLPQELRQSVRRYGQYRWIATQGVDEETLLKGLPFDFRRDIKRHLCIELVRQVPLFDQLDERMLDAICDRLKPALRTQGACLVREGDLVNEMLFIIRGHLDSYTTDGGRTGFFNSCRIGPGDFCGEELLTWALDPRPSVILPSSTRTVKAISEVETFVLSADDLKFVASQYRRLHSQQLRHTFRFYSPQWRTWAACYIQAAWRRFKRRKEMGDGMANSPEHEPAVEQIDMSLLQPGMSLVTKFASRLAASTRRGGRNRSSVVISSYQKPTDPDFTVKEE
ncbi:protein CNGC15b-like [Telopea speciosissima]|uniref:protein CNGC15b-like n=1 Tax=Telopea speciosissima TaxID=54955 RepID=UPI001CC5C5FA|nr:protein CNGC15b-like [Telopea speciosissima]